MSPIKDTTATPPSNVLQIRVYADGKMTVNGAVQTADGLVNDLARVAKNPDVVVWYWRETGNGPLSSQAESTMRKALSAVVSARLPIAMSTKPDFSDHLDLATGRPIPEAPPTAVRK